MESMWSVGGGGGVCVSECVRGRGGLLGSGVYGERGESVRERSAIAYQTNQKRSAQTPTPRASASSSGSVSLSRPIWPRPTRPPGARGCCRCGRRCAGRRGGARSAGGRAESAALSQLDGVSRDVWRECEYV